MRMMKRFCHFTNEDFRKEKVTVSNQVKRKARVQAGGMNWSTFVLFYTLCKTTDHRLAVVGETHHKYTFCTTTKPFGFS